LEIKQRYHFKKEDKLKSRKVIDQLFMQGKSFSNFPFRVVWLPENPHYILQAGVGVSSRNFKKAVDRNRIKRLMREAYRLQKNDLQQFLKEQDRSMSVFFLYQGKELPTYNDVFEKMGIALKRLLKLSNEKA
jgi:ribonuclease P protein component